MIFVTKILASSIIIAISTEIAKRNPSWGGLILALPLTSIVAFLFMGYQGTDSQALSAYAKSTLIFVPVSLIFFLPFVLPYFHSWSFILKFSLGIFSLTLINIILIKLKILSFR